MAQDTPQVSATFSGRILAATHRLVEQPRLRRIVPELHNEDIREIIVGSFRVNYRIRDDGARLLDATAFEAST